MTPFLRDLWHDLREKRLWPVAAALLLAVVAVPALLLNSGSGDSGGAPPVTAAPGVPAAQSAVVTLADETTAQASGLEQFDEKDPFKPRGPAATETATAPDVGQPDADAGSAPADESPASGGSPTLPGSESPGGFPTSPGTSPGDDGSSGGDQPSKPVAFAYVVDVRFGRRDAEPRLYRGLQRLDVLPRTAAPLLVFLGVSPTGKTAIFLLDSAVSQDGDGRCQPSKDECTFIHLNAERNHDLHFLTTEDGRQYAIRLLEIRKERVDRRARSSRAARSARGARGARARSAARHEKRRRPALGADEIVYER